MQRFPSTALEENRSVGAVMHALSPSQLTGIPVPKALRARDASVISPRSQVQV